MNIHNLINIFVYQYDEFYMLTHMSALFWYHFHVPMNKINKAMADFSVARAYFNGCYGNR